MSDYSDFCVIGCPDVWGAICSSTSRRSSDLSWLVTSLMQGLMGKLYLFSERIRENVSVRKQKVARSE